MIKLIPVTHKNQLNAEVRIIYESAFPKDERREWILLSSLITNPDFCFNLIFYNHILIGLISLWNFEELIFIEHFAIRDSERGKGYGTEVINQVVSMKKPVILEVEEPLSDMAIKRIRFYERLHFSVSDGVYFQPPYSKGRKMVKMQLMSFPNELLSSNFESTKKLIHQHVYNFQE